MMKQPIFDAPKSSDAIRPEETTGRTAASAMAARPEAEAPLVACSLAFWRSS